MTKAELLRLLDGVPDDAELPEPAQAVATGIVSMIDVGCQRLEFSEMGAAAFARDGIVLRKVLRDGSRTQAQYFVLQRRDWSTLLEKAHKVFSLGGLRS